MRQSMLAIIGAGWSLLALAAQQPLLGSGRGIDHVTLLTHDVTAAGQRFADDFGFTVGPARKLSFGFEAALIYFADRTYIELYGIHDRKAVGESTEASALDAPEGVRWVTLDVDSASRAAEALRKLGKPVFGPYELPQEGHWRSPRKLTGPEQPFLPGGRIFFIEYNPDVIKRFRSDNRALVDAREAHANGAEGLRSVWVAVDDLDAAADAYAAAGLTAGAEVELIALSTRAREIRTPGGTLLLVRQRREPGAASSLGQAAFSGLSIKVAAIDAIRSRVLRRRGVDLQPYAGLYGRSVLIPASLAHGTTIEFFEAPRMFPAIAGAELLVRAAVVEKAGELLASSRRDQ